MQPRLVIVSTYPPRGCGLASFARDLRSALLAAAPGWRVDICALDCDGLAYGPEVSAVIAQHDAADFQRAADAIASAGTDLVIIEHEYGIFGGPDGEHVRHLAAGLRRRGVPYAVTLHTMLAHPTPARAAVLGELCANAALVTVFTETGQRILAEQRLAGADRVVILPHGAPPALRQPVDAAALRPVVAQTLATLGRGPVLSTFGLIRPDKGLDLAIEALPAVVAHHPTARYLIAGATHADIIRRSGEQYRDHLVALAQRLGVQQHVTFLNTFLTDAEVAAVLDATDLYLTPYRCIEQISSGTLTFAVVAGCPTVSTAYRYAEDLLAPRDGAAAGVVVPCDSTALATAILRLLDQPEALDRARKAADTLGATLTWPAVAARFVDTLQPLLSREVRRTPDGRRPVSDPQRLRPIPRRGRRRGRPWRRYGR